jgi:hypothetical protein
MRTIFLAVPCLIAGCTAAQPERRPLPADPRAKVPIVEFRSAFEGYRPFVDPEPYDWRKANEEVGATGGHAGRGPGEGPGQPTSKPQPGKPDASGGHGAHK